MVCGLIVIIYGQDLQDLHVFFAPYIWTGFAGFTCFYCCFIYMDRIRRIYMSLLLLIYGQDSHDLHVFIDVGEWVSVWGKRH